MAAKASADLKRLTEVVGRLLFDLPPANGFDQTSWARYMSAVDAAMTTLVEKEGAKYVARGTDYSLSLGGVRSTCTSGKLGLMRNWLTSASKHLAKHHG